MAERRSPVVMKVGEVDDPLERAADQAAEAVTRGIDTSLAAGVGGSTRAQVWRAAQGAGVASVGEDGGARASEGFAAGLVPLQARGGRPLAAPLRMALEPRFGADFSRVRIHEGAAAAALAEQIDARAFTVGRDVFFNRGEFRPERPGGLKLLAHELAHVQQGQEGVVRRSPEATSRDYSGVEDIYAVTDLPADRVLPVLDTIDEAVAVIDRALTVLGTSKGRSADAVQYFVGPLDDERVQRLRTILAGAQENLRVLRSDPSSLIYEDSTEDIGFDPESNPTPDMVRGSAPGRYKLTQKFFMLPEKSKRLGLPANMVQSLIHETIHEYLYYSAPDGAVRMQRQAVDYSLSHGIVPLLPRLGGVDALDNAESVASVAVALGMNRFEGLRAAAEHEVSTKGYTKPQRQLILAAFNYANFVLSFYSDAPSLSAASLRTAVPMWLVEALEKAREAQWVRPFASTARGHERDRPPDRRLTAYESRHLAQLVATASLHAARRAAVIRTLAAGAGPTAVRPNSLELSGGVGERLAAVAAKPSIAPAEFRALVGEVSGALLDWAHRTAGIQSDLLLAPASFWRLIGTTLTSFMPNSLHADLPADGTAEPTR